MGKVLDEKKFLEGNIKEYQEQATSNYSKFFHGTPTFVTYYSRNPLTSTQDTGFENAFDEVGSNTPYRYDKINDFPLYGISELSKQLELNEFGTEFNSEGEAMLIPQTVKPKSGDFFVIWYNETSFLFEVKNIEKDRYSTNTFYKIAYTLSNQTINDIEKNITESYQTQYDNISTGKEIILTTTKHNFLQKLEVIRKEIISFYTKAFLNKKFDVLAIKENDYWIYDICLIKFIKDNRVLERRRNFYDAIYITDLYDENGILDECYEYTLFSALERRDLATPMFNNAVKMTLVGQEQPFYMHYEKFFTNFWVDKNDQRDDKLEVLSGTFVDNIKSGKLFDQNSFVIEDIIIQYFNNRLEADDALIDKLNSVNYKPIAEHYYLIAMLLFVLKQLSDDITK